MKKILLFILLFLVISQVSRGQSLTISSTKIPVWERVGDEFDGYVSIDLQSLGSGLWHLEVDVHDSIGNYLSAIIYPSINTATQHFYSTDYQLNNAMQSGKQFKFYAVKEANNQTTFAGNTKIIDSKIDGKNLVYYNDGTDNDVIKIPVPYNYSSSVNRITFYRVPDASSRLLLNPFQNNFYSTNIDNDGYCRLKKSNSGISTLKPGVFSYIMYSGNLNPIEIETGTICITKIGHLGLINNNDTVVVCIGGNRNNVEDAFNNLGPYLSFHPLNDFSIAENFRFGSPTSTISDDYNTWYIGQSNLNYIENNAYDIGIALKRIIEILNSNGVTNPKINIVSHSFGGLQVRAMLGNMGRALNGQYIIPDQGTINKIKTVTFLGTPHQGIPFLSNNLFDGNASTEVKSDNSFITNLLANAVMPTGIRFLNVTGIDYWSTLSGLLPGYVFTVSNDQNDCVVYRWSSENVLLKSDQGNYFYTPQLYVKHNIGGLTGLHGEIHHTNILSNNNYSCENQFSVLERIFQFIRQSNYSYTCPASGQFTDLIISNQSTIIASVAAGSNITVSCAEQNLGSAMAQGNVTSLHLSVDNILTPNNNGDKYLDEISFPPVNANSTSQILSKTITIPSNTLPGNYWLFFSADGGNAITELLKSNNQATVQIVVTSANANSTCVPPAIPVTNNPGILTSSGVKINTKTPLFTWNTVPNATSFKLVISKFPYGSSNIVYSQNCLTGTSYLLPAGILLNGSKYRWNLRSATNCADTCVSTSYSQVRYFEVDTSANCIYQFSIYQQNYNNQASNGSLQVTTDSTCQYALSTTENWITIINPVDTGSKTINYSINANLQPSSRIGTIKLNQLEFTITQDGTSDTNNYCYGHDTLTASYGVLSDGSENNNYKSNSDCYWLIKPTGATIINLEFTQFFTESGFDFVWVYDGSTTASPLLGKFSGSNLPNSINSSGGTMLVRFTSDNFINYSGWHANYTSSNNGCAGITYLINSSGSFSNGGVNNNYNNNSDCRWLILPDGATSISLSFSSFNTENGYDGIIVYDGTSIYDPIIGVYTGNTIPSILYSNSGAMLVRFISNETINASGFVASYQANISPVGNGNICIKSYEYWFDNNYSTKVTIPIMPVSTFTLNSDIPTTGLNNGLHSFHIRFKDKNDNWSSIISQFFNKMQPTYNIPNNIIGYEYWFDSNYDSVISQSVSPQQIYTMNTDIPANSLSNGLHSYHVRYKDNYGQWSSVVSQFFNKMQPTYGDTNNIVNYEYWFDNNYNSKVIQAVSPQQIYSMINNIPADSLNNGLHSFHIRYKDTRGQWSSIVSQFFNKSGISIVPYNTITAYRYWFDMDVLNMTTQYLTNPVNPYQLIKNICTLNQAIGNHTIHFQFKDSLQQWSSVLSHDFYKEIPVAPVISTSKQLPFCQGDTITLTPNYEGTYAWNTGESTQSINISNSGNYKVVISYCTIDTAEIAVNIKPYPANAETIIGPTDILKNQTALAYSTSPISNAFAYSWSFPSGMSTSDTGTAIFASTNNHAYSGLITVRGQNDCGLGKESSLFVKIPKLMNTKLYLEGFYNNQSGIMNKVQDDIQYHFAGTTVDTISLEIINPTIPYLVAERFTLNLTTDGTIPNINIPGKDTGSYYIVVKHRNHLETWSAFPVSFETDVVNYDFSSSIDKVLGNNQKQLSQGKFAIKVGDVNQDGVVDISDLVDMDADLTYGSIGYIVYDLNGDGVVDISDLVAIDENLTNGAVVITP